MAKSALALALGACLVGLFPARAAATTPLGDEVLFGAYADGLPYKDDEFLDLEKRVGAKLDIASGFVDWDYVLGEERDVKLAAGGRILLYSWEPHCDQKGHHCISFRDIAKGRTDAYLDKVAESMKHFNGVIYVRPWAEMNAHWSPYMPGSKEPRAGTVAEFKSAWRHLYDFFRARNVTNLKFVFTPDVGHDPRDVPIKELWPGHDPKDGHGYVDVLGMDGYNWGDSKQTGGDEWLEFEEVFRQGYRELTSLDHDAPVWVCEFGSKEPEKNDGTKGSPAPPDDAHDKGKWIENMLHSTAFPRLQALAYYSAYLPNHDNQRDFRFESSPSSLKAVRTFLKSRKRPAKAPKKAVTSSR
ncbi:MAG TPA: glycosyl hydrolase [Polyangiaceae bacterium]|nr:glycosyl hydrolase [Polyangiaceae bacterium]